MKTFLGSPEQYVVMLVDLAIFPEFAEILSEISPWHAMTKFFGAGERLYDRCAIHYMAQKIDPTLRVLIEDVPFWYIMTKQYGTWNVHPAMIPELAEFLDIPYPRNIPLPVLNEACSHSDREAIKTAVDQVRDWMMSSDLEPKEFLRVKAIWSVLISMAV